MVCEHKWHVLDIDGPNEVYIVNLEPGKDKIMSKPNENRQLQMVCYECGLVRQIPLQFDLSVNPLKI